MNWFLNYFATRKLQNLCNCKTTFMDCIFCWHILLVGFMGIKLGVAKLISDFCIIILLVSFFHSEISSFCYFKLGTFWFWNSPVVEPCSWKDMAHMYGTDCFTKDSPPYNTLVLGEIQTMDCCMNLPSE